LVEILAGLYRLRGVRRRRERPRPTVAALMTEVVSLTAGKLDAPMSLAPRPQSAPLLETTFFFSRRRRHTISLRDWSSDVCSSDLPLGIISEGHRIDEDLVSVLIDEVM